MKNIKVNLIEKRIIRRKILNFISPVSELPGYDKIKKLLEIIFQNTNKSVNTFKIYKGKPS
ncbi:MAG: hypothetical protein LH629_15865 [Ignavibacteria bacterium]|nr:hypothetical protein [Ignavibacteria bacterium]